MSIIPKGLSRKLARQVLTIKKNSPGLLFVGGILGVGVSTVLACRATLKLEENLDEFKKDIDAVNARPNQMDDQTYREQLARTYIKGSYNLVKLYAPAILVGGAAIGALTGSHVTLTRRNVGLTAAYSALSASFDSYRDRVRKELGEEKELDIRHAVHNKVETKDGVTESVPVADPNQWSPYARFFEESNRNWVKNPEMNRVFVQSQQNYCNHLLHARGHVFLNEVYDLLGIPRSKAGQVVGWVIGQGGDNYIDFGIFEARNADFVNGWERSILLDFNVDGVIYDKI